MPVDTPGERSRRETYHHGDLRSALMTTALRLIEQHGVEGFTLKDAAQIAGVSPAAPYRHFADKQALLAAIHQEGFALFDAALRSAYESERTPRARLEEMGVAYVRFALDHTGYFRVMFGRETASKTDRTEPEGFLLLTEAIASLAPRASAARRRDLTLGAWSLVHGFAFLQLEGAFKVVGEMAYVEQQLRRLLRSFSQRQT